MAVAHRVSGRPGTRDAAASGTPGSAMHTLTENSVLPCSNAAATTLDPAVFDRARFDEVDDTAAASARIRSLDWHLEAEWLAAELAAEPSGVMLAAACGAGCLFGVLAAALLDSALPALAFGGALGAYAGVLAASLWVSRDVRALR